jgi:hypothetical protein
VTATEVVQIFTAVGGPSAVAWIMYRLVVLPQKELKAELRWYKNRFKADAYAKAEHRAAVETAELGAPSRPPPPRERLDTLTAVEIDAHYSAWEASRTFGTRALAPPMTAPRRPRPPVVVTEVDGRSVSARPTLPAPRKG